MMWHLTLTVALAVSGILFPGRAADQQQPDPAALDRAFTQLAAYDYGRDEGILNAIDNAVRAAHEDERLRKLLEARLIEILEGPATPAGKTYVLQKLSDLGSVNALPALARCLRDDLLSHPSRIALEHIADPAGDKVLREALPLLKGKLKVGIIDSLGNRRDAEAVPGLREALNDPDTGVVHAAAYALGKIATSSAVEALLGYARKAPEPFAFELVDAQLRAAGSLIAARKNREAVQICTTLYRKGNPEWVRLAAFNGLVDAQTGKARELLSGALAGDDDRLRGLAARRVSEMQSAEDLRYFAEVLRKLPPGGQAALIDAWAVRGNKSLAAAIRGMLRSGDEGVRIAAFAALGGTGGASDIVVLAETAAARRGAESAAARQSLVKLEADGTYAAMLDGIPKVAPRVRAVLIDVLVARAGSDAENEIAKYIADPDADVRAAAMSGLRQVGGRQLVPPLVALLKNSKSAVETANIEKALKSICGREGEKCSPPLLAEYRNADKPLRLTLLDTFSSVGGAEALGLLRSAVKDGDAEFQDAAIKSLSNWPSVDAISDLQDIARTAPDLRHYVLAFRGYIRLVRTLDEPAGRRAERLRLSSTLSRRPDETKLILGALGDIKGSVEALNCAEQFLSTKDVAQEAIAALLRIAPTLGDAFKLDVNRAMRQALRMTDDRNTLEKVQQILSRYGVSLESPSGRGRPPAGKNEKE